MAFQLWVRPEAEADLAAAYGRYEEHQPGLGRTFLQVVEAVFARISRSPRQLPIVHQQVRRTLTKRFPFAVFYIIENQTAVVLAVLHQASNSERWKKR